MVAASGLPVLCDVFMAGEALLCLPGPIATVMALRALLLELGVGLRQLAWHQQLLDAGSVNAAGIRQ